jgi:hypothetical protein
MGSLLPLRQDLLRGDYRCLYLAWLRSVQEEEVEDDEHEPPVPPGLREESEPLSAFGSFFEIELDLIEAAAEASGPRRRRLPPTTWRSGCRVERSKRRTLCCASPCMAAEQLSRRSCSVSTIRPTFQVEERTRAASREQPASCERRLVRAPRTRPRSSACKRKPRSGGGRPNRLPPAPPISTAWPPQEEKAWDQVGDLIATKRPNDYDRAVQLLLDPRDLAARDKREADFRFGLRMVREEHANKPSLQRRLNEAGLPDDRSRAYRSSRTDAPSV